MAIVITGARLIDGTGRPPQERAALLLEGKRLQAVGPEDGLDLPGDATVIDAGGRTVLPGLMDLHVGMAKTSAAERPFGMSERNIAMSTLRGVANGRRCLDVGVTTVRVDYCGHHGIFALKEAFASGMVEGPRLIVPGRGICMTGGHSWEAGVREADGPDQVRKAAREELKAGADWVKLMATGGMGAPSEGPFDEQLTVEEMRAAVEEAHKKGKYAYAHVSSVQGARNAIAAGIDSIEHGIELDEEVVRAMVEKGIFLVPTLSVYNLLVERGARGLVPEQQYRKALGVPEKHVRSFRLAMEAGVKIATGTDSGGYWNPAGPSMLYELELMNQAGMAPMDVLVSATRRAAECLRMQEDLGTLEAGKLADVLIVEGNPLANISAIRNSWMVLKEGRIVFSKQPVAT